MVRLAGFGLGLDVHDGWEGRVFRRPLAHGVGETRPVLHLANFAIPEARGDFGAGAVEHMRSGDCFVVVFDYGPEAASKPLFRHHDFPELRRRHFDAANLQRTIRGQAGAQLFFQSGGRGFCVYVVLGSARDHTPVAAVNSMFADVEVGLW